MENKINDSQFRECAEKLSEGRHLTKEQWRILLEGRSKERRKELAKDVKKKGEAAKVAVRNIRRDGNVAFKKLKGTEISEDGIKDLEDELQKITDKYIEKIDKMVEAKSKEIMTV